MRHAVKRPISPLQVRMIEDMTARKLHPKTQTAHIRSCRRFAAWLGRSPDTATADDVRRFQVWSAEWAHIAVLEWLRQAQGCARNPRR